MSVSTDQFDELRRALGSPDPHSVLSAVWNILDLAAQVADQVAWTPGYDELHALVAAQSCMTARSLLPLPTGSPLAPPDGSSPDTQDQCLTLLRKAHSALIALAVAGEGEGEDEGRRQLELVAGHASDAAEALAACRRA